MSVDLTTDPRAAAALRRVFAHHPRVWERFAYVYPVISRRAGGLSIGINLNPDGACNFDCVYCCVDRRRPTTRRGVDLEQLRDELDRMLHLAVSGELWRHEPFEDVPAGYRRIRDIAFSGDGEPTASPRFADAVDLVADARQRFHLDATRIVLITNATLLDRPAVQAALATLDEHAGDVWAKLDAGTVGWFARLNRSRVPLTRVLGNLLACGQQRPIVIQTMLVELDGRSLPEAAFEAWIDRLIELRAAGCRIRQVQLYTLARPAHEPGVAPVSCAELDRRAARLRQRVPELPVTVYPAPGA